MLRHVTAVHAYERLQSYLCKMLHTEYLADFVRCHCYWSSERLHSSKYHELKLVQRGILSSRVSCTLTFLKRCANAGNCLPSLRPFLTQNLHRGTAATSYLSTYTKYTERRGSDSAKLDVPDPTELDPACTTTCHGGIAIQE